VPRSAIGSEVVARRWDERSRRRRGGPIRNRFSATWIVCVTAIADDEPPRAHLAAIDGFLGVSRRFSIIVEYDERKGERFQASLRSAETQLAALVDQRVDEVAASVPTEMAIRWNSSLAV
jgi:hypothetical protein